MAVKVVVSAVKKEDILDGGYVFTLAMCAQPAGQIIYGALFDWFSDSPYWVLIPSGLLVCVIGLASSKFFVNFEKN